MRDNSWHGIAATMVFAEYLTQEAPDRRDRAEHSAPKLDTMFVENVPDAGLSQDVRERKPRISAEKQAAGPEYVTATRTKARNDRRFLCIAKTSE